VWGADYRPIPQIKQTWVYLQPALFGTIGAALIFKQISALMVGDAILLIFVG
jgi:hypothetical protein